MKIAMLIIRTIVGLLFIFASVTYFLDLIPQPELTGNLKEFNEGMAASGYLLTLVKATELTCGLLLVFGRFVPLVLVVLAPIVVNILMVHIFLDRTGLPIAIILVGAMAFLAYYYRRNFECLFNDKLA